MFLKTKRILVLCLLFLFWVENPGAETAWPPKGTLIRCPVTRDTNISSVNEEKTMNSGWAWKFNLKGQQECLLIDIDPSLLKGKNITGALLHIRSASPETAPLARLGVSSLASQWEEGTSMWRRSHKGTSCYQQAQYEVRDWAYPGSTLTDVVFGKGHTLWKFADCTPPDREGWQTCALSPDIVAARIAGLSYGFCVYDEVGSVWSLKKGKFDFTHFPNRLCYSKESWGSDPWLDVWYDGTDTIPPLKIKSVEADVAELPAGQALIRWQTPEDRGIGKTLGFQVSFRQENSSEHLMPRYLIPMAGEPGEEVILHIQDMNFKPGEIISLSVRPVDSAGNIGEAFTKTIQLSSGSRMPEIPEPDISPFPPDTNLPRLCSLKVAVTDLLDKTDPKSGKMIPEHEEGYKGGNHIFSAKEKLIRLQGARNETIAFQINLESDDKQKREDISVSYEFDAESELRPKIWHFAYVSVANKDSISYLPDPLIPSLSSILNFQFSILNSSLICEVHIPHDESPGKKHGKVILTAGGERLELDVELRVWNFTLPDKLSFIPEMNAYGKVSPYKAYNYYRLAHEHRTCMNRLPYGWNGKPEFAPKWNGNNFDWSEWDEKVGPLLDGSAFDDLPRKNEPVEVFYLPFSENWPINLFDNYTPSYWADEAFTDSYAEQLKTAFALFAKHCNEKGWHDTVFQFYLNNKLYYRKNSRGSSAPWIFDEPLNTQDFWAIRWYGLLWRMAVDPVMGNAKMWYRGDISYSEFSRNMLWGVMDIEYIGGNTAQKTRMKHDEQILHGNSCFAEYGTANKIEEANTQPVLWCLSAWAKGCTGVLPWQTIGGDNCWKTAEQTALFYPGSDGPKPSVRLKAFTRGQQDTEYLTLFCDVFGIPQYAAADWLRRSISLDSDVSKSYENDAGTLTFAEGDIVSLWKSRYRLGKMLSDKGPAYKRSIVNRETPYREIKKLPDIGYVPVSPAVERYKPDCDTFKP